MWYRSWIPSGKIAIDYLGPGSFPADEELFLKGFQARQIGFEPENKGLSGIEPNVRL
jgi:hypothetical protein